MVRKTVLSIGCGRTTGGRFSCRLGAKPSACDSNTILCSKHKSDRHLVLQGGIKNIIPISLPLHHQHQARCLAHPPSTD